MSKNPDWNALGIVGETQILQLLFDPLTENLIVHFVRNLHDGYGVKSLYSRHISEDRYHRITEESDTLSFECPKLSPVNPHVYLNVMETCTFEGKHYGYNWNSVRKVDILRGEVVSILKEGDLILDDPYSEGWVRNIHAVTADGESVYCSLGLQRKMDEFSSIVDYYLAELSLKDRKYKIITKLEAVFL